jgi:tRNA A37 methylthiotransferase MiaB
VSVGCLNKINRETLEGVSQNISVIASMTEFDSLINANIPFNRINNYCYDKNLFDQLVYFSHWLRVPIGKLFSNWVIKNNKKYSLTHMSQIIDEFFFTNKAYVQIGSGCLNNCSYCVIKKARGNAVSRSIAEILSDIRKVYKKGMVLNLVADDCGSYGFDIGENIFNLLSVIGKEFHGIAVELCYVNPTWLEKYPDEYLEIFKNFIINSINIPLQSGSDRIVQLMNRKYAVKNILSIIGKIKMISPNTMIWGNFIVDYPTETWKEFYLTLKASMHFHHYDTFIYSPQIDEERLKEKNIKLKNVISCFNLKKMIARINSLIMPFRILFLERK